jgi:cytochrome b561
MNTPATRSAKPAAPSSPAAPAWSYTGVAVILHWLLALLFVVMAAVGWLMMEFEDEPGVDAVFALHKSFGLLVMALVLARLAWRLTHPPQPLPSIVPVWQTRLALLNQGALYLLMLLIPLAGYVGASYSKEGAPFFGVATPRWATANHDLSERFFDIHGTLIWVLVALLTFHVLGALKHLLLDKDGIFDRILLRRSRP